jgi:hypothetical protein
MGTPVRALVLAFGLGLAALSGCAASHQSEESARKEVQRQEELRQKQVAEEAAANAELARGEKSK